MIAKLMGLIDSRGEDWVVLDVAGVGYLVSCSARTLGRLPGAGQAISLLIEMQVREDAITLYGFHEAAERDWFRRLISVQGVGAKVALSLLSVLSPDQLATAIAAGDKGMLLRATGVGPKLAARVLNELKDRVADMVPGAAGRPAAAGGGGAAAGPDAAEPSVVEDVVSALVNLGYGRSEAFSVVARLVRTQGEAGGVAGLVRAALRDLGQAAGA
ncbi:MAG: Holliday junction branch migration protein RuvA [Alphaproteobacteria bacterium]